jgi:hypothetical protein
MQMGMAQMVVPALATLGAAVLLGKILTARIISAAAAARLELVRDVSASNSW